jgi:arylsulfatase B
MRTRREFLASASLAPRLAPAAAQPAPRKPNIVLLFADDLGYGELGCQGNPEIPTPHIDSIARNGIRFTDGYVTAPVCCPSRAGLMTGRYQTRFGHEHNATGKRNLDPAVGLPLPEKTMADHLKAAGYATALIGKWHLGGSPAYHPQRRGFDEFYGFLHEGHFYYPPPYRGGLTRLRVNEPPYDDNNPIMRGSEPAEEPAYLTDALAREACAFIDRRRGQPFFLYLAFNAIHSPMQAPVALMKEFEGIRGEHRRLFAAMMRSLDNAVGQVLAKLTAAGLDQDTLIFFLSDNGGPTAELTSSNHPLRGGKGQLYEGGIRVPFLAQWKGRLRPGEVSGRLVSSLDILPTALAAAGSAPASGLDGVSLLPGLLPEMTGGAQPRQERTHFWRYGPNLALRRGAWKIVRQTARGAQTKVELFDLANDPGEQNDLASREPARLREMEAEAARFNAQMRPPLWT